MSAPAFISAATVPEAANEPPAQLSTRRRLKPLPTSDTRQEDSVPLPLMLPLAR